ncbi:MAG: DMT family transporter [Olsenella sp.]|jgi:drug/metabolite transporter (DMT)-like permease|nr:DMT family transporter [Olsenella sp.]
MGERRKRLGVLLALHLLLMLYSTSGILSKTAARYPFMSPGFILSYGGMIAVLGVYAIGWQQVIKRIPLTTAYANRAVTVIWGIIWGAVLFHEGVSPLKVVGALVVLAGVVLFALADSEDASATDGEETRGGGADE